MREIKFQAWDSHQKKMLSWEQLGEADENNWLSLWNVLIGAVEHIKPRQYTGIKDNNGTGNEMAQDDIVYASGIGNGVVDKNHWGEWGLKFGNHFVSFHSLIMELDLGEIQGNIHQHPHLLEKSK